MKSFISPYVDVLIPALGTKVMDVTGRVFMCKESIAEFSMSYDDGTLFPMQAGLGFELERPEKFHKLEFVNPTSSDITISFYAGEFKIYNARALNITRGITDVQTNVVDAADPDITTLDITLPKTAVYRKFWIYFDATTFPANSLVNVVFFLRGQAVLTMVAIKRYGASAGQLYGMAISRLFSNNSIVPVADGFRFANSDGNACYTLNPNYVCIYADAVGIRYASGPPSGTVRALLAVQSSDQPFP